MKKVILFLLTSILFSSCATLLNRKKVAVTISSDNKSKIVYEKDTIEIHSGKTKIYPKRSKQDLKITVLKDSLKKEFRFKRKVSSIIYLNYFNYGLGLLVDLVSDKRFTYRRNFHFVTNKISKEIVLNEKKVALLPKNTLFIYTSPLQFIDPFSTRIPTIGVEYFLRNNLSLSAEYGFSNSPFHNKNQEPIFFKDRAETYRLETKLYNNIIITNNVHLNEYIGLEYRGITSQYDDNISYFNRNDNLEEDYVNDNFGTKKIVSIINLKYGIIVPLTKHFYFDFYTGFGVRTKNFNQISIEYDESIHSLVLDDWFFPSFKDFKEYDKKSFFNYSLGFKFGFKL